MYHRCACLLFLCLSQVSLSAAGQETHALPPITLKKISESEANIVIDGEINEAVWSALTPYDYFRVLSPDTLKEVPYETRVRAFYSERGLYFSVWAEQPKETLVARLSSRTSSSVEMASH